MNNQEILRFCLEKGFLLDKDVLNLFDESEDTHSVKLIIEKIKEFTNQKIITQNLFNQNKEKIFQIISSLPGENQHQFQRLKISLGVSIEISKEVCSPLVSGATSESNGANVRVLSPVLNPPKKVEVGDFIKYFRGRVSEMRGILQGNPSLKNPMSISKLSGSRQNLSIIGIVSDKNITSNKNVILEVEDLTGRIKVLINQNNAALYEKAKDICLDSVLGFVGVGNREIIFASDVVFPDSSLPERKKSSVEECALFIGDLHFGSKNFLEKEFMKFIDYLSGNVPNTPEVEKIKYLFLVGDIIAGVGNYPNQERFLKIMDIEEQFIKLADALSKIKKDIKIIISPGNHDGVRLMEPQPILNERYAWSLHDLKNVILTGNPAMVNIGATENFSGFNILTYHGVSFYYYANTIPKLIAEKALKRSPDKIAAYLLQQRHLAPTHASIQYFPLEEDPFIIRKIPDVLVSGHAHKTAISYYNNILIIFTSSWESKTPYQEKMGNEPDYCKVPMLNLKTRTIKILDFEEKEK